MEGVSHSLLKDTLLNVVAPLDQPCTDVQVDVGGLLKHFYREKATEKFKYRKPGVQPNHTTSVRARVSRSLHDRWLLTGRRGRERAC